MPITLCALRYQAREQHMQHVAHKHSDEIDALRDENERLRAALEQIESWCDAYPITVFAELDLKKAAALLAAGGMTLDGVSASAARHVLNGVSKIVREGLAE
jgi:hypothetical protein